MIRRQYRISGRVQGVGFRYFTQKTARKYGVSGWVKNCFDGSVEAMAQGEESQLQQLEADLRRGPSFGYVEKFHIQELPPDPGLLSFRITY